MLTFDQEVGEPNVSTERIEEKPIITHAYIWFVMFVEPYAKKGGGGGVGLFNNLFEHS